jgi:hypothetical protein
MHSRATVPFGSLLLIIGCVAAVIAGETWQADEVTGCYFEQEIKKPLTACAIALLENAPRDQVVTNDTDYRTNPCDGRADQNKLPAFVRVRSTFSGRIQATYHRANITKSSVANE